MALSTSMIKRLKIGTMSMAVVRRFTLSLLRSWPSKIIAIITTIQDRILNGNLLRRAALSLKNSSTGRKISRTQQVSASSLSIPSSTQLRSSLESSTPSFMELEVRAP